MIGYDIGCGFSKTANSSPLLGPKIKASLGQFCVGSFHGHAHCRICQLDWHPLYVQGCGLEDFETCERVFSRSNALAGVTRHASTFHRRQLIHRWFETWNREKFAECSGFYSWLLIIACLSHIHTPGKFIYDNYKQALRNIHSIPDVLQESMRALKIPSETTFPIWLSAEREYLSSLKHEPPIDILKMEYLETLIKFRHAKYV